MIISTDIENAFGKIQMHYEKTLSKLEIEGNVLVKGSYKTPRADITFS